MSRRDRLPLGRVNASHSGIRCGREGVVGVRQAGLQLTDDRAEKARREQPRPEGTGRIRTDGRRPPLRERSPHERRHERRSGGGPLLRQARHEKRPGAGRSHRGGGYPPKLPPRTIPAPAPRSPPPTPRRSAGQPRSASAENPHPDPPTRSALGPSMPRIGNGTGGYALVIVSHSLKLGPASLAPGLGSAAPLA
jgi:hypothetical protein